MKNLEHLIGLLEARAAYYKWCAETSADYEEQDWTELRPLYSAQAEALESAVAEVRAAIVELRPPYSLPITGWLLATEMGGLLTANPFLDRESAIRAKDQFCERHFLKNEAGTLDGASAGHAHCEIREFTLLPRQDLNPGDLDGRYVVMSCFDEPNAISVLETKDDAEAEVERLKEWFGDDAWVCYHPILIPQNSTLASMQSDEDSCTYH